MPPRCFNKPRCRAGRNVGVIDGALHLLRQVGQDTRRNGLRELVIAERTTLCIRTSTLRHTPIELEFAKEGANSVAWADGWTPLLVRGCSGTRSHIEDLLKLMLIRRRRLGSQVKRLRQLSNQLVELRGAISS